MNRITAQRRLLVGCLLALAVILGLGSALPAAAQTLMNGAGATFPL
jgi:hypothetical protein